MIFLMIMEIDKAEMIFLMIMEIDTDEMITFFRITKIEKDYITTSCRIMKEWSEFTVYLSLIYGSMDEMIISPRKEKDKMYHFPPQSKEMESYIG